MIKIVIGSMVICHLLVPNKDQIQNTENAPIIKVLGEVLDITKGNKYIEQVDKKTAIEFDTDMLLVKAKNKEGSIYQIDSRACMSVRKETDEERINRVDPPKKKVIIDEEKKPEEIIDNKDEIKKIAPVQEIDNLEKQEIPAVDVPKSEIKEESQIKKDEVKEAKKEEVKEIKKEEVKEIKKEEKVKNKKGLLDYLVE